MKRKYLRLLVVANIILSLLYHLASMAYANSFIMGSHGDVFFFGIRTNGSFFVDICLFGLILLLIILLILID